jgi:hypothetical protein
MRRINGKPLGGNMPSIRAFNAGFGVMVIINLAIIVAFVCGVVWGCNKVKEKGLKGCVESVWEGDNTNAPPATIVPEE